MNKLGFLTLKWLAVFVLLAAVTGYYQPQVFNHFADHVPLLLAIVIFGMGATLTLPDFRKILKHPGKVFIAALLQFTIMPVLASWWVSRD